MVVALCMKYSLRSVFSSSVLVLSQKYYNFYIIFPFICNISFSPRGRVGNFAQLKNFGRYVEKKKWRFGG